MENVIKSAIRGGYEHFLMSDGNNGLKAIGECKSDILLDPLFWQCLGKAEGWTGEKIRMCNGCGVALKWNEKEDMNGQHGGKKGCGSDIQEYEGQWLIEMHRFIDHLAEGKSIDEFFNNLLT